MKWKEEVFKNFKLYAVTDIRRFDLSVLDQIEAAYRGGADIVQLRSKTITDSDFYHLGLKVREIADRNEKLFFVNDRLDLACAVSADGIHLGQNDLPLLRVRDICRKAGLTIKVGKSTHSLEQAVQAQREEADYIGVGPMFATPTKADYPPVGVELISRVAKTVSIPFVCIGGIDLQNIDSVLKSGATRIAVVRAIFQAKDVYEATRKLRKKIDYFQKESK